jgi:hypothetical protein
MSSLLPQRSSRARCPALISRSGRPSPAQCHLAPRQTQAHSAPPIHDACAPVYSPRSRPCTCSALPSSVCCPRRVSSPRSTAPARRVHSGALNTSNCVRSTCSLLPTSPASPRAHSDPSTFAHHYRQHSESRRFPCDEALMRLRARSKPPRSPALSAVLRSSGHCKCTRQRAPMH